MCRIVGHGDFTSIYELQRAKKCFDNANTIAAQDLEKAVSSFQDAGSDEDGAAAKAGCRTILACAGAGEWSKKITANVMKLIAVHAYKTPLDVTGGARKPAVTTSLAALIAIKGTAPMEAFIKDVAEDGYENSLQDYGGAGDFLEHCRAGGANQVAHDGGPDNHREFCHRSVAWCTHHVHST